ncbi:MAG: hypothetical protein M1820_005854 [Bogoriella megaspora]|nr:MAG: hypothetical protein M1820_005854 [Bogoriella megaspora]
MTTLKDHYDVIVVGAGIQGLCAAHTFLSVNSSLSLLIVDDKLSVGGTWAKEQVYPGLRANNLQGYFEFSDFPILDADVGVKPRGLISGEAAATYLHKYAEHFDLLPRLSFNTSVIQATNDSDATKAWTLRLMKADKEGSNTQMSVTCSKLLVATGQTSRPFYPSYPGTQSFRKKSFHTVHLASTGTEILQDSSISNITILGGGKSAQDAVYRFASNGKRVTWIIRKTGRGGLWLAKPYPQIGPVKAWLEGLLMTRPLSWFGAAPWSIHDGFGGVRYLLHNTAVGRFITRNYFANVSKTVIEQSGILKHESTKKLVPKESLMWYGGQAAISNYDTDFYDTIRDAGVKILYEDVARLDNDAVVLENGERIQTDALVYATGYEFGPSFPLLPATKQLGWGIPVTPSPEESKTFRLLDEHADTELFIRFPELKHSPSYPERELGVTPWRLWRFIAPLSQVANGPRNLAFLTNIETYQNFLKAELVSLWAYAYLNNELDTQPGNEADVAYEASLWSRFGKWRCPMGSQGKTGDTLHDNLPYYDTLLGDLGLNSWRKGWGLIGEVFGGAYELKEYEGIVAEWIASRKQSFGLTKKVK